MLVVGDSNNYGASPQFLTISAGLQATKGYKRLRCWYSTLPYILKFHKGTKVDMRNEHMQYRRWFMYVILHNVNGICGGNAKW